MDYTPPRNGLPTERFIGVGIDTRAKLHLRAQELTAITGYAEPLVTQAHFEQAKREVGGEPPQRRPQAHPNSVLEARRS